MIEIISNGPRTRNRGASKEDFCVFWMSRVKRSRVVAIIILSQEKERFCVVAATGALSESSGGAAPRVWQQELLGGRVLLLILDILGLTADFVFC